MFYQNSDFSFLGQVFQYCLLGLKSMSVEDCIIVRLRQQDTLRVCRFGS
jgi:hypothetical protein